MSLRPIRTSSKPKRASYSSFKSNWGKKERSFNWTRKKVIGICLLSILVFIFLIGDYGPIRTVLAEYNADFFHTRTTIFSHTSMEGTTQTTDSYAFSNRDGDDAIGSIGENEGQCFNPTITGSILTVKFALRDSGALDDATGIGVVRIYATTGTYGTSCARTGSALAVSDNFDISTLTLSYVFTTFTFSGTNQITLTETTKFAAAFWWDSGTTGDAGLLIGTDISAPTHAGNAFIGVVAQSYDLPFEVVITVPSSELSRNRWNFNSTCVTPQTGLGWQFDYTLGSSGSGGNNCSSANVILTKSPVSFQTIAGRMLEIVMGLTFVEDNINNPRFKNMTLFLTQNQTLPKFSENYNPVNDPNVRFLWISHSIYQKNNGKTAIYIVRDESKSLADETFLNDIVIEGTAPAFDGINAVQFQTVLNFTGPLNLINTVSNAGVSTATSTNSTSGFQMGRDYYIGVQAMFDTSKSPCTGCIARFSLNLNYLNLPETFSIFSVPASCSDKRNFGIFGCPNPTITPTFDVNPTDPRTWANGIIKGLVWAFTTAIPSGLSYSITVTMQFLEGGLNTLGNLVGWGNIGTSFVSLINSLVTLILQIPTAFGWITDIINRGVDLVTTISTLAGTIFGGLVGWSTSAKNIASAIVTILGYAIFVTPVAIMTMDFVFYFVFVAQDGLAGFGMWGRWNKWLAFGFMNIAARIVNILVSLLSWLIGRIPTFSGTRLPGFPLLHPGEIPTFKLDFRIPALARGDVFSVLLTGGGFTAFIIWIGSSTGPFSTAVQANISPLQNLFLPFITMLFILAIGVLPVELMRRLGGSRE